MFATSKALTSNFKNILSKIVLNSSSQAKNGQLSNIGLSNGPITEENGKTMINNMTKNIYFGITHAKQVSEISHEVPVQVHLKKLQKTAAMVHCFNPRSHHEEDVPIRIIRTHYTVTFLPSVQFLQKEFADHKDSSHVYNEEKDFTLSVYNFSCKHCGHSETRSFPENGYKYGTVITGCDQCHQVMIVSDHLGWVEPKKEKHSTDLIFSKKHVHDLIKRNLKKVGIDADKEKELE